MTRKEDMAALRADTQVHYNCAQSVVVPFAQDMGLTRELAYDLALNFGGGMGCGATCGALIGALAVLGGLGQPQERGEEKKPHCDGLVRQCVDFVCRETGLE